MFSGRWEGGSAVTLSSFTAVNSRLSDVTEGEFIFTTTKKKNLSAMSASRGQRKVFGKFRACEKADVLGISLKKMSAVVAGRPEPAVPLLMSSFFFLLKSSRIS